MKILGIGGSDHDVASCIVENGEIKIAIEEERISRDKYALGTNLLLGLSRKYCLKELNLSIKDMDAIVVDDILAETAYYPLRNKVTKISHHLAHAASVYYPSPFSEAAVLIVDNAGSLIADENGKQGLETISYGIGSGLKIDFFEKITGENWIEARLGASRKVYQRGDCDDSLGHFYKIVSGKLGFKFSENGQFFYPEAGKTMGLAPYGDNRYYKDIKKYVDFGPKGRITMPFSDNKLAAAIDEIIENDGGGDKAFQCHAHIAKACQQILEESLTYCCEYLYEQTKMKYLCYAGGVALNCVANGKLKEKLPFEDIFLFPACGDNGTAIGCALWGTYNAKAGNIPDKKSSIVTKPYFGRSYGDDEIEQALQKFDNIAWEKVSNPARIGAQMIYEGKIIGWFQGGCEFGPRALGHRSILADPRNPEIKDIINSRVKFREAFRPYAPSVLRDHVTEIFERDEDSPFMLLTISVKEDKRAVVPGITHVDGTARIQTVTDEDNGIYTEIIREFYKLSGIPLLLNTSFNVKGEPIVETPEDAVNCYLKTGMDFLIMKGYIVSKKETTKG